MAKKFLTDINIAGGVYDSSGDIGSSGQVLSSTGSGINWINANSAASVVYQDGFTGNGSATAFTLANSIDNENKTQVYIDGVYQHKDNYSLSGTTLTFSTAPPNSSDIEVISFSSVSAADDILYDTDFGSAGLMTTNGSGVYSITANNSANWNTAYGWGDHGLSAQDKTDIGNLSGTNTGDQDLSSYATQSYVGTQIANLVDSSPSALNTLNELAAALGDDANFSTTVTNSIALKAPIASPTFTGFITTPYIKSTTSGNIALGGVSGISRIQGDSNNDIRFLNSSNQDLLTLVASSRAATFARNVGIGVTPEAHYGGYQVLDIGNTLSLISNNTSTNVSILTNNAYLNSGATAWVRKAADEATMYEQVSGQHRFSNAGSAAAGAAISWSETMRIHSNGRVSIGSTTASANTLTLSGTGTELDLSNTSSSGKNYRIASTSSGVLEFIDKAANVERMRIHSDGSVGIGATPTNKLHVSAGTTNIVAQFQSTDGTGGIMLKDSSGNVELTTSGTHGFNIQPNGGSTVFRVDQDGNVGIGTTSPSSKLHVTGAPANGVYLSYLYNSGTHNSSHGLNVQTAANNIATYGLRVNTGGDTNALAVMGNGNVGIGTATPLSKLTVSEATGQHGIELAPGTLSYLQCYDRATSAYGNMTIDAKYLAFGLNNGAEKIRFSADGNIGIGTTSPSRELDIQASSGWAEIALRGNTGGGGSLEFWTNTTKRAEIFADTEDIVFRNTATNQERMRINSAGNVGIGTTSPGEKLDVQGNILVGDYFKLGSSANYMGQLGLNRNIDTGGIYNSSYGAYQIQNYQGDLQFQIYNSSGGSVCTHEFFNNGNVFFNGNVGIGTTSFSSKLNLYSAAAGGTPMFQVMSHATAAGSFTGNYMAEFCHAFSGVNHAMLIKNNETDGGRRTLDVADGNGIFATFTNGRVGIGTTSPTSTLSVQGTTNHGINVIGVGTTATRVFAGLSSSNHGYISVTGSSGQGPSVINSAGGNSYISDGNVGIGLTGPETKLQVKGAVSMGSAIQDGNIAYSSSGFGNQDGGSLHINYSLSAATSSGDTITFTYAATVWKSWSLKYNFASTAGITQGVVGGYWNNSGGSSNHTEHNDHGVSVAVTHTGQGNTVTFTFTNLGTHPMANFVYMQGGGDGQPRADRVTLSSST